MRCLTALFVLLMPLAATAGAQKYEPLSASVQAALSRTVSDQAPPRSSFQDSMAAVDWLVEMSRRLEERTLIGRRPPDVRGPRSRVGRYRVRLRHTRPNRRWGCVPSGSLSLA